MNAFSGPRYLAIVSAIAEDVERGNLKAGDQMPTHRDLASLLGVTTATITRAYTEAAKRGLLVGETGRGTFVKPSLLHDSSRGRSSAEEENVVDFSLNLPPISPGDPLAKALTKTLTNLA